MVGLGPTLRYGTDIAAGAPLLHGAGLWVVGTDGLVHAAQFAVRWAGARVPRSAGMRESGLIAPYGWRAWGGCRSDRLAAIN